METRGRVLITGATGRVGREVTAELAGAAYEVIALSRRADPAPGAAETLACDLQSPASVQAAFAAIRPDAVVHLAAIPGPRGLPPEEVFRTNALSTFNVVEAAATHGVDRLVYASSGASYGFAYRERPLLPDYLPLDERHPQRPQDAYGLSKQIGEEIVAAFVRRTGARAASLRFPLVVMPENWPTHGRRSLLAPGQGSIFSYVDARDLALAFRLALESDLPGHEIFLIAAADALAPAPLAEVVPRRYPGSDALAAGLTGHRPFMSAEKARRLLGWVPRHSWRTELPDLAARWPLAEETEGTRAAQQ